MISSILAAASDTDWPIITDLVVILVSAAVVAVVMQPMRLAAIPAYLIAGAVIGPRALGLVPSPESLGAISHLAIILLLFGIGLELNLSVLRHRLARMIVAGFGSCLLSIVVGGPVAIWFGLAPPAALAVCMALALSSTAVVLRIIAARRDLRRTRGRLRDGREVVLRPLAQSDFERLYSFFGALPEEDRLFLAHDVSDPDLIRKWTDDVNFERVIPLVALDADRIVGDGTLHIAPQGWMRHVGQIRLVTARSHRGTGLVPFPKR